MPLLLLRIEKRCKCPSCVCRLLPTEGRLGLQTGSWAVGEDCLWLCHQSYNSGLDITFALVPFNPKNEPCTVPFVIMLICKATVFISNQSVLSWWQSKASHISIVLKLKRWRFTAMSALCSSPVCLRQYTCPLLPARFVNGKSDTLKTVLTFYNWSWRL